MTKNIIVTGSGGILGTALRKELINISDVQIFAITSQVDRLTKEHQEHSNVHIFSNVEDVPEDLEYVVVNGAFPRSNKGKELATAFEYTENLIHQLSKKNIRCFVNISSQSVYAQSGAEIQTEVSDVEPSNLYGMTKYAVEQIVRLKAQEHGMKYINIRLGSLASATFDQRMINRFYKMIKNQETITVDQGTPKVSYLHVEDAADALIQLSEKIFAGKEVSSLYNLANNDWMTIKDLVAACQDYAEEVGLELTEVVFSDKTSEYNNVANSDLFYKDLEWAPKYSMQELITYIFDGKSKM